MVTWYTFLLHHSHDDSSGHIIIATGQSAELWNSIDFSYWSLPWIGVREILYTKISLDRTKVILVPSKQALGSESRSVSLLTYFTSLTKVFSKHANVEFWEAFQLRAWLWKVNTFPSVYHRFPFSLLTSSQCVRKYNKSLEQFKSWMLLILVGPGKHRMCAFTRTCHYCAPFSRARRVLAPLQSTNLFRCQKILGMDASYTFCLQKIRHTQMECQGNALPQHKNKVFLHPSLDRHLLVRWDWGRHLSPEDRA